MVKRSFAMILALVFVLSAVHAWAGAAQESEQFKHIQTQLIAHGYPCQCTGMMDEATVAAIKQFQKDHGLKDDGICGPMTMKALEKAPAEKARSAEKEPVQ